MAVEAQNSIDQHIGRKLQVARVMAGLSTNELAHAVEVAGDQVVRWEAGGRLAAGDLFAIAKILNQPISYFYEGLVESR